jgi:hypothetical protein
MWRMRTAAAATEVRRREAFYLKPFLCLELHISMNT